MEDLKLLPVLLHTLTPDEKKKLKTIIRYLVINPKSIILIHDVVFKFGQPEKKN